MSVIPTLRPSPPTHPQNRYKLKEVLTVSKPFLKEDFPSILDVNHVFVSTLPTQWSHITNAEYDKLDLSPEDPNKTQSMWEENHFYAIKFKSAHSTYRFFVEQDRESDRWFVLARPPEDLRLYARNEPGWECS